MADSVEVSVAEDVHNGTTHSTDGHQTDALDGAATRIPEASESDALLSVQVHSSNGGTASFHHAEEGQNGQENTSTPQEESTVFRVKRELNEKVYKEVRLWMVILAMLVSIVVIIVISVAACSATHVDEDDKFDRSTFDVPQRFRGSFKMPKQAFTTELLDLNSTQSQALAAELQTKLADLYGSSPALGRYFEKAEIKAFRSDQVTTVDYLLTFLLPKENLDELRSFTLSREVVYNVLRQFLDDQEPDESGQPYIDPASLQMFS